MIMPDFEICQVAYFVPDIRAAARQMTDTFGAGPFFVIDRIELAWGEHRGENCPFVHSSAYGQWGEVMMELVQQDSDGASPFRDLYAPGQSGLHHVATMVDDLPQAYTQFAERGMPIATRAATATGTEFAVLDATAQMGHFIEVYERSEGLLGFYGMVKQASAGWRGSDPIRMLR